VWHASISLAPGQWPNREKQEALAREELQGVGDPALGEWVEWRPQARPAVLHLRRRLSRVEAMVVGPMQDIRGTDEHRRRVDYARRWYPKRAAPPPQDWREWA